MDRKEDRGLLFDEKTISAIRDKFCRIDVDADGKAYPKAEQVARCGNAVCPPIPAALVRANLPELCGTKKTEAAQ